MKKILLFILMLFVMPLSVSANTIHSIDIDVYIDKYGNANITEVWDVDGTDGTEWYKVLSNMGNMELSDFTVSMDGEPLLYKEWNIDESLLKKRGYYGINYISNGIELCFGKYDYDTHIFTLKYKLSNFVFNTEDSQLIYYNFIDKLSNVDFREFNIDISSYYDFSNTLDVWGYGYNGYAFVKDGKISMYNKNKSNMNNKYSVLLAKFPLGTFDTSNRVSGYDSFKQVYKMAKKGSFKFIDLSSIDLTKYTYEQWFIFLFFVVGIPIFILEQIFSKFIRSRNISYEKTQMIDIDKVPLYRDIPCNKDIYYANGLLKFNKALCYREYNIFGAIILKWVKNNKIGFRNEKKGIFNKETSVIDLTLNPTFDNKCEEDLFNMMYKASRNGYLHAREFEIWCDINCMSFLTLFDQIENFCFSSIETSGITISELNKRIYQGKSIKNIKIYEESIKLCGLNKYLEEFSNMNTKEVMDVKIWDEYLMFAYLFGIADKVRKQLKHMYPEFIPMMQNMDYDYNALSYIDEFTSKSISTARDSRDARKNDSYSSSGGYSSGGGGRSFGGGGGGSFGGGGGGSR